MAAKRKGFCALCYEPIFYGHKMVWSKKHKAAGHINCVVEVRQERIEKEMLKFYSFVDHVAIETDEPNEGAFNKEFSKAIFKVMQDGTLGEDFPFFLEEANARSHDLYCKYRGYKADKVREIRTLICGNIPPSNDALIVTVNERPSKAASNGNGHAKAAATHG